MIARRHVELGKPEEAPLRNLVHPSSRPAVSLLGSCTDRDLIT
jgi:hypothetical protein